MAGPQIAFVTMVRDEPFFLPLWVDYYSRFVASAQLFVVIDGFDQALPDCLNGCQVLRLPRAEVRPGWDEARWNMLSSFANTLLGRFDIVVLNDVDELVVLDPAQGDDLVGALAEAQHIGVISPFAIELVHRTDLEPSALDPAKPVLAQRRFGRINASYCKPCITARPIRWSLGGHYSDFPQLYLSSKLFLFHLKMVDAQMMRDRHLNRVAIVSDEAGQLRDGVAGGGWTKSVESVDEFMATFRASDPEETDFSFDWQRRKITQSWQFDAGAGIWRHAKLHNRRSYRIPDRFRALF